jgi:hypothetical protein
MNHSDPFETAIKRLGFRSTFWQGDRKMVIACLVREQDWRPLKADWWKGKEVCIIGADLNGNFFLCHCDGSVRYWDHKLQADSVIAQSVRNFATGIVE